MQTMNEDKIFVPAQTELCKQMKSIISHFRSSPVPYTSTIVENSTEAGPAGPCIPPTAEALSTAIPIPSEPREPDNYTSIADVPMEDKTSETVQTTNQLEENVPADTMDSKSPAEPEPSKLEEDKAKTSEQTSKGSKPRRTIKAITSDYRGQSWDDNEWDEILMADDSKVEVNFTPGRSRRNRKSNSAGQEKKKSVRRQSFPESLQSDNIKVTDDNPSNVSLLRMDDIKVDDLERIRSLHLGTKDWDENNTTGECETKMDVDNYSENQPNNMDEPQSESGTQEVRIVKRGNGMVANSCPRGGKSKSSKLKYRYRRKCTYTPEEKQILYGHHRFLIEARDTDAAADRVFLWRVHTDLNCVQKFLPHPEGGRIFHLGSSAFRRENLESTSFYAYYQPVYVMPLVDDDEMQVIQYFPCERKLAYLCDFEKTKHLYYPFQVVVQIMISQVLNPNFIMRHVLVSSPERTPYFGDNWDKIDEAITSIFEKVHTFNWSSEIIRCLITFSKINLKMNHAYTSKGICGACGSKNKSLYFICSLKGPLYDSKTFLDSKETEPEREFYCCNSCGRHLRAMHRLFHHRRHIYGLIQSILQDQALELEEEERYSFEDTLKFFLTDYEWLTKMFLDFQLVLAESSKEIDKKTVHRQDKIN